MLGSLFGDDDAGGDWAGAFGGTLTSDIGPVVAGRRSRGPRPEAERGPTGLAGLLNQGATCYLNSLLQTLCASSDSECSALPNSLADMTPELRAKIYSITPEHLGFTPEALVRCRLTAQPALTPS